MSKQSSQKKNPLNMYELYEGGPFVLPATLCSQRRAEFLRRANDILGFYSVRTITSKQGSDVIFEAEQKGRFQDSTPFRLKAESGGIVAQLNYGLFKKLFANAGGHLTNQAFLMLYGNLEAFLADLVLDALTESSGVDDAYQETLNLMVLAKWRGKIDRISQKLKLGLGKPASHQKFLPSNVPLCFIHQGVVIGNVVARTQSEGRLGWQERCYARLKGDKYDSR